MAYEPGDLAIKMDGYKLNIRSVGIIIHNGKVLLHKKKISRLLCIVRWTRENRRKLTRYSKT